MKSLRQETVQDPKCNSEDYLKTRICQKIWRKTSDRWNSAGKSVINI